jgi:hypothetical protein
MTDPSQQSASRLGDGGDYTPPGEDQGQGETYSASQIATAFEVAEERIVAALAGEFDLGADARVDSRQAQHLAEVVLGDLPLDRRQAALMALGAYTPRADHDTGLGERTGGIESDRLVRNADRGDEERG